MGCPISGKGLEEESCSPEPTSNQSSLLSGQRVISSIPKHSSNDVNWKYPSEQMFMTALKKKGYRVPEQDISVIVPIHNIVNEKCWVEICRWERQFKAGAEPVLVEFEGKPQRLSPKAFLKSFFLGYCRPFDRHDWIIEVDGQKKRYIIDFYQGKQQAEDKPKDAPVSIHLDVRPALGMRTLWQRFWMWK
jgi:cytochrome c heme-lyase